MNPTLNQIRNLNTQEAQQMRRYQRRCLDRISQHNKKAKDQYEKEQDNEQKRNPK